MLDVLVGFIIHNLKLLRHDFEGTHGFHVVRNIVIASLGLLALLFLQAVQGRRVGNEQEVGVVLRIHHGLCNLLQLDKQTCSDAGCHDFGKLIPDNQ